MADDEEEESGSEEEESDAGNDDSEVVTSDQIVDGIIDYIKKEDKSVEEAVTYKHLTRPTTPHV